ncbi:hypothetical protein PCANC_00846 [Puccinia coronata f. sp. avenae]|uniref:Uncharacterized protein n=1 Tax=Puccinia coronata f. sp. avenae TaxID=200324 RepID=A0A2N5W7R4_9BASI|nr:hypothetical protein PCANC_00846 [Puccinia coronata f. sp. avenae]
MIKCLIRQSLDFCAHLSQGLPARKQNPQQGTNGRYIDNKANYRVLTHLSLLLGGERVHPVKLFLLVIGLFHVKISERNLLVAIGFAFIAHAALVVLVHHWFKSINIFVQIHCPICQVDHGPSRIVPSLCFFFKLHKALMTSIGTMSFLNFSK